MKVKLIMVGKTVQDYLVAGVRSYQQRIIHYIPFDAQLIPDLKNTKNLPEKLQKKKEGELILQQLQPSDFVVLLDENGKSFSSVGFAGWMGKQMTGGIKNLVFVIGGAYGFSESLYQRSNMKMSLSRMTFSHQMVRLIFIEQLYRALTIIKGEPYHHQ
ncbi:MAG: 23S rRNA (pseudouridine(1915)-N(3))-methyltransferase RlmH [Bacteroidales bacterium]|jgi:23S rRNA (pseudouridine1915-N3)-methyltransferase|nr:23S rRNA (pseudouridine(1915)-N(3))-methyltransferase RlmH [Bacteroidales bacterium]